MISRNLFFGTCFLLMLSLSFSGCKKDAIEGPELSSDMKVFKILDQHGELQTVELPGSIFVSSNAQGETIVMSLDEYTGDSPALELRESVSKIAGHLETSSYGKIAISYDEGKGKVVWELPDFLGGGKAWADITCVNRVGEKITVEILVTDVKFAEPTSTIFFETGADIYFALQDKGNPGNGQPNDQFSNSIARLFYGSPYICSDFGFGSYSDASGNIVVK